MQWSKQERPTSVVNLEILCRNARRVWLKRDDDVIDVGHPGLVGAAKDISLARFGKIGSARLLSVVARKRALTGPHRVVRVEC